MPGAAQLRRQLKKFPRGGFQATADTRSRGSWITRILPYIEQQNVQSMYDFTKHWHDPANALAIQQPLQIFQCPSAPENHPFNAVTSFTPGGVMMAPFDYTGFSSVGASLVSSGLIDVPKVTAGILGTNEMKIATILDGMSNTLMLVECANRPNLWLAGRPYQSTPTAPPLVGHPNSDITGVLPPPVGGGGWAHHFKGFSLEGSSTDGRTLPGPCPMNCTNNYEAYSFHSGGMNIALADGSVRFVSATMTIRVFAAIVSAAGGEVANLD